MGSAWPSWICIAQVHTEGQDKGERKCITQHEMHILTRLIQTLCIDQCSLPLSLGQTSVISDNVIPHWSDDVMPCPQVITPYPAG